MKKIYLNPVIETTLLGFSIMTSEGVSEGSNVQNKPNGDANEWFDHAPKRKLF